MPFPMPRLSTPAGEPQAHLRTYDGLLEKEICNVAAQMSRNFLSGFSMPPRRWLILSVLKN
jgi:hypothetical protein